MSFVWSASSGKEAFGDDQHKATRLCPESPSFSLTRELEARLVKVSRGTTFLLLLLLLFALRRGNNRYGLRKGYLYDGPIVRFSFNFDQFTSLKWEINIHISLFVYTFKRQISLQAKVK